MVSQSILNNLETYGYLLLNIRDESSLEPIDRLAVLLHQEPTGAEFEPKSIYLKLRNWDKTVHWTTIDADTPFPSSRSVCPGKIAVFDRSGDEVDFLVFGGTLEGSAMPGEMLYSLHSDAPILSMTEESHSVDSQFAIEVEAILAEEQARQGWKEQFFWQRLLEIDPFQLYVTCIDLTLNRYEQSTVLRQTQYLCYVGLQKKQERLAVAGKWPKYVRTLGELLR